MEKIRGQRSAGEKPFWSLSVILGAVAALKLAQTSAELLFFA
jgi:hypothetical protein